MNRVELFQPGFPTQHSRYEPSLPTVTTHLPSLPSTDPLSVAEREGAKSLVAFNRDWLQLRRSTVARSLMLIITSASHARGHNAVRRSSVMLSHTHTEGELSWSSEERSRRTQNFFHLLLL